MTLKLVVTVPWGERLGGAETMLSTFLLNLDRSRVHPVVVFFEQGSFEREMAAAGIDTTIIEVGRLRQLPRVLRATAQLASGLRHEQPDLILNWIAKAQVYGAAAAIRAGMRDQVVWWQHSSTVGHWLDRLATALPALAVGCSSAASARAQQRIHPTRRTFVVHPGVVLNELEGDAARSATRRQLGIPATRTVLGIVGRLQPWKGQDRFIRAVAELRAVGFDVHGLVVGGDAHRLSPTYAAGLEPLARELGIAEFVSFTGHVSKVDPYLAVMDIFINAADEEPFGIVILEAMAAGVPVVAVGKGGPAEIIINGRTGILTPSGAPEDLVNAAARLVGDPALRGRLSAGAHEHLRAHFSVDAMVEKLTAALESLAR
jgi:glycosyltransferase involved in cell wall biosynthesis